jgi:hypothetical protein
MTKISYTAIAASIATSLVSAKSYEDKAASLKDDANKQIAVLHKAKVVVGRKGKCSIATAFYDALISGGLAAGTSANYLTTFREAVATGKPVREWNPAQSKNKGASPSGARAGSTATSSKPFADLFRSAFNHEKGKSFMALCEAIENQYQADSIKTMYEGFVEYFKAEGHEIEE